MAAEPTSPDTLVDGNRCAGEVTLRAEPVPPIARTIAERLAGISEDKGKNIAPILQGTIALVAEIKALGPDKAGLEPARVAMAKLEEHVVALFEQLDILYGQKEIEQFAHMLLSLDIHLPEQELTEVVVDLEHEGTHEAKWHFTQLVGQGLAITGYKADYLLGRLALFYLLTRSYDLLAAA